MIRTINGRPVKVNSKVDTVNSSVNQCQNERQNAVKNVNLTAFDSEIDSNITIVEKQHTEPSRREQQLLILCLIITILTTILYRENFLLKASLWITTFCIYIWSDQFDVFLKVSVRTRHIIAICTGAFLLTVNTYKYTKSLMLLTVITILVIFIIYVAFKQNDDWLVLENTITSSDWEQATQQIEELEYELLRSNYIKEQLNDIKQSNKNLVNENCKLQKSNDELLQSLQDLEQQNNAVLNYTKSLEDKISSLTAVNNNNKNINISNDMSNRDLEILTYYNNTNMSMRQIASKVNCSRTTVSNVIKKYTA